MSEELNGNIVLARLISDYRKLNRIPVRKLAQEIGIYYTTLWRFERGQSVRHEQWSRILCWLMKKDDN